MDFLQDAVKKLKNLSLHSGCEDGNIVLWVNPDKIVCQFERGACMEAVFGGRVAEFVTFEPTRATTRLGFLFDATLEKPAHRAAACAIINVMAGFLCISRVRRSCSRECHEACRTDLLRELGDRRVGGINIPAHVMESFPSHRAGGCDVTLVGGEGLISPEGRSLLEGPDRDRALLVGPSTSGVASLEKLRHWCPYGKG
ncbi:MAG: hypothetical protein A4E37_00906 [Methanoregulaceae archaeon PtaB.Bin056]|jgi:hypothetical protein|nr:MAG: hypothetical protein A4E37_00906 [Methanoregulaceae archaeon PtaB.Bin056]